MRYALRQHIIREIQFINNFATLRRNLTQLECSFKLNEYPSF
jgi:hypothetical protein